MGTLYTTSSGKKITLDQKLGEGGEGEVWTYGDSASVAKIYHPHLANATKENKLKAMVANQPLDEMWVRYRHVSIAWPTDLLYQGSNFAGFIMPKLGKAATILEVYNPSLRKRFCPGFNYKYLIHTALNLSKALKALHDKGYVMGDINEGNILVTDRALVTIIDTDSFQVRGQNGTVYRCPVGKEEFTPPELQGKHFDQIDRLPEHDYFGLAILIFHLLMEGFHPYDGVLKSSNPTSGPAMVYCLNQGAFPYARNPLVSPPTLAPRFEILPPEVQKLLLRCFVEGYKRPSSRPTASDWSQVLEAAESKLKTCKKNSEHLYSSHLRRCAWCEREEQLMKARLQTPLPSPQSKPAQPPAAAPAPPPSQAKQNPAPVAARAFPNPLRFLPTFPRRSSQTSFKGILRKNRLLERIRAAFRSRGQPLNGRIWWVEARQSIFYGTLSGLGLFLLVRVMFLYPQAASYGLGAAVGGLVFTPAALITRRRFPSLRRLPPNAWRVVALILLVGLVLAAAGGFGIYTLFFRLLTATTMDDGWLVFDCAAVGLLGGTSWGTYQAFVKRKSKALAWIISLAILLIPLAVLAYIGTFDIYLIKSFSPWP